MKKDIYIAIAFFLIMLAAMSCEKRNSSITPLDKITSEYLDIQDYTGLNISDAFTADVNFTENPQPIEIIANENLHPYIEVFKSAGVLYVGLQNDISINGKAEMKVILQCDYLTGYTGNGASLIILRDTLLAENVTVDLGGASNMNGSVKADKLLANLRDASLLELTGYATDLNLTLAGASRMTGFEFSCEDLQADFSDASSADLTVNATIDINATDASQLKYRGDAIITAQDLRGASSVVKGQ